MSSTLHSVPGAGFAAAATPAASATVVHTDTAGLEAGPVTIVTIPSSDFPLPAYVAHPQTGQGWPVILVVSEIFGVHEHIADIARRFAQLGYLAIAPDLFARRGDAASYPSVDQLVAGLIEKTPDAEVLADLDAAVDWARTHGGDITRLGVTGFCWGGRITWMYAAHQSAVRAGVAWYGKLKVKPTPQKPLHPVDVAGSLHAPVLGLYGGQDSSIPVEQVGEMRVALAGGSEAARGSEIVVYPEAGHAFFADYRPSYAPGDADDAWRRCLAWLARHGVAP